jgi:putative transcriptional regulator
MACVLGVSRQTLSSIENGHWDPSIRLAYKIARYFHKPIEDVFLFDEDWEAEEPAI